MSESELAANEDGAVVFNGTNSTHEIVSLNGRLALAESLAEAKVVARAISRVLRTQEVRIYAAYATLPHSSYRNGSIVR